MFKLLGYKKSDGVMEKDGQKIEYSSRFLRGFTDEGFTENEVGLIPFEHKIKSSILCQNLGCSNITELDAMLNSLLGSTVSFSFGVFSGSLAVTGFTVLERPDDNTIFTTASKNSDKK